MPWDDQNKKFFGFHRNIFSLKLVSLFADVSRKMIYPFLPVFLTPVLGTGTALVDSLRGSGSRCLLPQSLFGLGLGSMPKEKISGRFLPMGFLRETFSPPRAFSFGATMTLVATLLLCLR